MAMSKKCYAAILSAKEASAAIKELTDEAKGSCTKAYKNLMKIAEINDKYYRDFKDVDPAWSIDNKQAQASAAPANKSAAPVYEEGESVLS